MTETEMLDAQRVDATCATCATVAAAHPHRVASPVPRRASPCPAPAPCRTTHHKGCACWEAQRDAAIEQARRWKAIVMDRRGR